MLFERRPVDETKNTLLVHSLRLKEKTLKKGHVISASDIDWIKKEGIESIVIVCLQEGDIGEDQAAEMLARELAGNNIDRDKPFTGRCNLHARVDGLLQVNETGINQINRVHESLTIATLPAHSIASAGQLIATIKTIPYSAQKRHLVSCLQLVQKHLPILQIAAFQPKTIGLIQTRLPGLRKSILDKTFRVLSQRLENLGCEAPIEIRCDHDAQKIIAAIASYIESGVDIIILSSASAIADRRDVIPSAITQSGGKIQHFGMPVDPGNLLLLAQLEETPIIGMPGCARSPKLNGFDFVLQRLLSNIPVTSADVMNMGVGGLLKEIDSRPQLRDGTADHSDN